MQDEPEILEPAYAPRTEPQSAPAPRPQRWWLHGLLFVLTFLSATWAQSVDWQHSTSFSDAFLGPLLHPVRLWAGLTFAVALMTILLAHEMGHYLTARRFGVDQTLPYFIPAPTLFGTLGAVILMRSQPPNRAVLLKVAVMGPYAGLFVALPAVAWGLAHSQVLDTAPQYTFGGSLLWHAALVLFAPKGIYYAFHPVALAGWAGLLVTSLNLIPAAQLDGGHVAYALFGRQQERISRFVVAALFAVGMVLGMERGGVWVVWSLLLFFLGLRHPPVRNEIEPLRPRQRLAGYLALAVFVLTFVPSPIRVNDDALDRGEPSLQIQDDGGSQPAEEFRL